MTIKRNRQYDFSAVVSEVSSFVGNPVFEILKILLLLFTRLGVQIQLKYVFTRLLGRNFYFNCKHFLFVYIAKQKQKVCEFHKQILCILKIYWKSN